MSKNDPLAARIPHGEFRRVLGGSLMLLGLLIVMAADSIAVQRVGSGLLDVGVVLFVWGSVLGWLRVLEERQIVIQQTIAEMERAELQRDLGRPLN